MVRFEINVDGH